MLLADAPESFTGMLHKPSASHWSSSLDLDRLRDSVSVTSPWGVNQEDARNLLIHIVDDEELNVRVARKYLRSWGFQRVAATTDPHDVVQRFEQDPPDLVLLDVMMPEISGLDVLKRLRSQASTRNVPIIILTAHVEDEIKHQALELGANDFLCKPIDPLEMLPRVRNLLELRAHQKWLEKSSEHLEAEVQRRTAALVKAEMQVVHCLARAAEYRDNETGRHVVRVGMYSALIARALGYDDVHVNLIREAAKLHDVGKIGIPDAILLKAGTLDPEQLEVIRKHCEMGLNVIQQISQEEFQSIRRHAQFGASILDSSDSPLLSMAAQIAMTHHEKWDGTGYPFGIAGEEIPIEGRIVAVADVFDALSTSRPYKAAFPLEKCLSILAEGRGRHFDPQVVDAFFAHRDEFVSIMLHYADNQ